MTRTGRTIIFAQAVVAALAIGAVAHACETPVFEYTIENWPRDSYMVRYFHEGGEASRDAEVNAYLDRVGRGAEGHVNLSFKRVDVGASGGVSGQVEERIWREHSKKPRPFHAVISPKGHELFVGRLTLDDARALVGSPGRDRLAKELARGTYGTLLLVAGADLSENEAARAALRQVIEKSRADEHEVGSVEVRRDDPAERWLVRQVMTLESDLADLDNAMVFPVFGRGHVMEPYLGKGITVRNLDEIIAFMSGPCACEIKSASIGMDMLTDFDWSKRTRVAGGEPAAAPSFALFDIKEAEPTEPVVSMRPRTTPRQTTSPRPSVPVPAPEPDAPAPEEPDTSAVPIAPAADDTPDPALDEPEPPHVAAPAPDPSPEPQADVATAPAVAPVAAEERSPASEERALASGPDLEAASVPVPAALIEAEAAPQLGQTLSVGLGLVIGVGTLVVLLAGMALVLRPRPDA
jgi:hypothetical protein